MRRKALDPSGKGLQNVLDALNSDLRPMTSVTEARNITLALLADRAEGATVCPSEVARALVASDDVEAKTGEWPAAMPVVHGAVDQLIIEGSIKLSWKGKTLTSRAGPYRINRSR